MDSRSLAVRAASLLAALSLVLLGALSAYAQSNGPSLGFDAAQVVDESRDAVLDGKAPSVVSAPSDPRFNFDPTLPSETEPNGTSATATPLTVTSGSLVVVTMSGVT